MSLAPVKFDITGVPCFRCSLFFSKYGGGFSVFILCRKKCWSNSAVAFYSTLKFGSYRGSVRVILHISAFSLVRSANSVFIGGLLTSLRTKISQIARVIAISQKYYSGFSVPTHFENILSGVVCLAIMSKYRKHETLVTTSTDRLCANFHFPPTESGMHPRFYLLRCTGVNARLCTDLLPKN